MKENQEYIRKRRPINFTLDGIEYQILNSMPGTSRSLPSRSCKTKKFYESDESLNDTGKDYGDKTSSDSEDELQKEENLNDDNSSNDDNEGEIEREANLNESTKNSTQHEVSDTTEDETDNEEENKNNGEFNWSDVDFEEMYNDKEQMKKLMEYDEECWNSKFVVVETPIDPPDETSDEDNEEQLYALGFL